MRSQSSPVRECSKPDARPARDYPSRDVHPAPLDGRSGEPGPWRDINVARPAFPPLRRSWSYSRLNSRHVLRRSRKFSVHATFALLKQHAKPTRTRRPHRRGTMMPGSTATPPPPRRSLSWGSPPSGVCPSRASSCRTRLPGGGAPQPCWRHRRLRRPSSTIVGRAAQLTERLRRASGPTLNCARRPRFPTRPSGLNQPAAGGVSPAPTPQASPPPRGKRSRRGRRMPPGPLPPRRETGRVPRGGVRGRGRRDGSTGRSEVRGPGRRRPGRWAGGRAWGPQGASRRRTTGLTRPPPGLGRATWARIPSSTPAAGGEGAPLGIPTARSTRCSSRAATRGPTHASPARGGTTGGCGGRRVSSRPRWASLTRRRMSGGCCPGTGGRGVGSRLLRGPSSRDSTRRWGSGGDKYTGAPRAAVVAARGRCRETTRWKRRCNHFNPS